ncbi:acetyl xylan esterase [Aspergillus lucknowensis]|uniref:Carboxylic ester hydrolase n=1 Tax=Aspergillus lucknowensis TaxID=176173 RepID=A0ABR4M7F2_9EURO
MAIIRSILTLLFCFFTCGAVAQLQQITDFGDNPTNVGFYIYVPQNLATNPAIVVAIHYCSGTADAFFAGTHWAQDADTYGFIVIYPQSPYEGTCWDVSSEKSLTHGGGGNSNSIANMVTYTIDQYGADASRVFVMGTSSGAMMTNVMAATYPELFAAGIAYSGVAAGCFYSDSNQENGWNSTCSGGQSISTPEHWAEIALAMDPGYDGARPKMRVYHGDADTTLAPQNYYETCKQWAGVFGYNYDAPEEVQSDTPMAGWETTVWGPNLEGILASGIGHDLQVQGAEDLKWFGFTIEKYHDTLFCPFRGDAPEDETGTERKRKRVLVPGCGRGYDVIALSLHGFDAYGLEISSTAVSEAESFSLRETVNPSPNNFGVLGDTTSKYTPGTARFLQGDFFDSAWSDALGFKFDVIYDYTVWLCPEPGNPA